MDKDNKKIVKNNKRQGNERINIESFRERVENIIGTEHGSQAKAAVKLNVSGQLLSDILAGRRPVTVDFLIGFSNVYGCSIDYLLGTDKNSTTEKKTATLRDVMRFIHFLVSNGYFSIEDHDHVNIVGYHDAGYPYTETVSKPCLIPDKNLFCAFLKEYRKAWELVNMADLKDKIMGAWLSTVPDWFKMPFENERLKAIILNSTDTDFSRYYGEIPD